MRTLQILAVLAIVAMAAAKGKGKKPNFIFFLADDYAYNDASYRNPDVKTPRMQELVENGILFTNGYTSQQCSPSRSALMSGRYPYKTGMQHGVIHDTGPQCMDLRFKFIPGYLKDLGYSTHMGGKWHLGYCNKECTPPYRGFDTFTGGYSGEGHYFNHTTHGGMYDWHTGMEVDRSVVGMHSQDIIQNDIFKAIDNNDGSPFFYFASFHNTHAPLIPKPEFLEMYKDYDVTEDRKKYLGLITGMDYAIGKVVDKLKEAGLYDNTYLILSSDNGGDVGEGDNSPRRGAKSSLFEGGAHAHSWISSPLLKKKGIEADGLMHITDWLPTIVKLAGGKVPKSDGVDGVEQIALVTEGGQSKRKDMIYNVDMELETGPASFGCMAVRDLRYKLIWGFEGRSDGYGMNVDFIYQEQRVIDAVEKMEAAIENVDKRTIEKRGGPYTLSMKEENILNSYVAMKTVTMEDVKAGRGPMMLFDLQEDPNERNDLAGSDKPEHKAAKRRLVRKLQKAAQSKEYYKLVPRFQVPVDKAFDGPAQGNALVPGWCEDIFPGTK
jgi:arylsulfatase A-like enzyme